MIQLRKIGDCKDFNGKRILVRVDLNVPIFNGEVSDLTRIIRSLPTIKAISQQGGKVVLLSHFGRPKGKEDAEMSLRPLCKVLSDQLNQPVYFSSNCIGQFAEEAIKKLNPGEILLLENTRFHSGEEQNEENFVNELATVGDYYVNDAFSTAHRAHASTEGIAHKLPSFAGLAMIKEIDALNSVLSSPKHPVIAIIGGSKVSTKIDLLTNLVTKVEFLVIGGAMANTFLVANGINVGKSICEHDLVDIAKNISAIAATNNCEILLPDDVVVAQKLENNAIHRSITFEQLNSDDMIFDIGPNSIAALKSKLNSAKTLLWNGPLGAFEFAPFDKATVEVAQFASQLTLDESLVTIAGGGDTVAALNQAEVGEKFTYVSSAGGAFLEWLEGKVLPGVKVLEK